MTKEWSTEKSKSGFPEASARRGCKTGSRGGERTQVNKIGHSWTSWYQGQAYGISSICLIVYKSSGNVYEAFHYISFIPAQSQVSRGTSTTYPQPASGFYNFLLFNLLDLPFWFSELLSLSHQMVLHHGLVWIQSQAKMRLAKGKAYLNSPINWLHIVHVFIAALIWLTVWRCW